MNPKSSDNFTALLIVACVVLAIIIFGDRPEHHQLRPLPEDTGVMMKQMWEQESSPEDRYAILTGLTAMECIRAGLCELAHDDPVRSPSE